MPFRIRKDGDVDRRYGPSSVIRSDGLPDRRRISWGRGRSAGGGCLGAALLLSLVFFAALFVIPFVVVPMWVITELQLLRNRRPAGGFRLTPEEVERYEKADRARYDADVALDKIELEGSDVRKNVDGHFDQRSRKGQKLEEKKAELMEVRWAAQAAASAVEHELLARFDLWAGRQRRVWAARGVLLAWLCAWLKGTDAFDRVYGQLTKLGDPSLDFTELFVFGMVLGVVAVGGGLVGIGFGAAVVSASPPRIDHDRRLGEGESVVLPILSFFAGAAILGWLFLQPHARSTASSTSPPPPASKEAPAQKASASRPAPTSAPRPSASSTPTKRSRIPTVAEWNAGTNVEVSGAPDLGCETRKVREWMRVSCRSTSSRTPTDVTVTVGGGADTFRFVADDVASIVFRHVEGTHLEARFSWADGDRRLVVDWPAGEPVPSPLGRFVE